MKEVYRPFSSSSSGGTNEEKVLKYFVSDTFRISYNHTNMLPLKYVFGCHFELLCDGDKSLFETEE